MVRGEPPPAQHWQDQRAGGGLPTEQEPPTPITIDHWATSLFVFTLHLQTFILCTVQVLALGHFIMYTVYTVCPVSPVCSVCSVRPYLRIDFSIYSCFP